MSSKRLNSIYADSILNFIKLKKSLGVEYKKGSGILSTIDKLAVLTEEKGPGLTKEFCKKWLDYNPNIHYRTRYEKCSILRQFSKYLIDLGIESHLPPPMKYRGNMHVPYIYTNDQITSLFSAIDDLRFSIVTHTGLLSIPALIRFLFATGVRLGEALRLQNSDVNISNLSVKITDNKNNKERLIPISDSLADVLRVYLHYKSYIIKDNSAGYFFSKTDGSKISQNLVRWYFYKSLDRAGILGDDKLIIPRIHDLRHTFAVNSLIKIIESGNDPYIALPILSKFLGHSSVASTNSYVRLTAAMHPKIINNLEMIIKEVFPKTDNL